MSDEIERSNDILETGLHAIADSKYVPYRVVFVLSD